MKKYKISIVDDHPLFRKGLVDLIADHNSMELLFEAVSGQDLLQKLQTSHFVPDLILLDIEMPNMNGEEVANLVKMQYPDIKILVLSMHHEEKYLVKLLEKGINGYITKDSDPEVIAKAIDTVMNEGSYFNSQNAFFAMHNKFIKPQQKVVNHDLTKRELQILEMICNGNRTSEIAEKLFISPRTVEGHRNKLLEKSGSKNSAELVCYAVKYNLFDPKMASKV